MGKKQVVGVVGTVVTVSYPTIGRSVSVDYAKLEAGMQLQSGLHGLKQKLGDAESGGTPQEKYAMAQRIVAGLAEGQWELTATPVDLTPIICEAVARIKKIPLGKIQKAAAANEEQVKGWGSNAQVKAEILKIRAERAAKAAEEADDIEIEIDEK